MLTSNKAKQLFLVLLCIVYLNPIFDTHLLHHYVNYCPYHFIGLHLYYGLAFFRHKKTTI